MISYLKNGFQIPDWPAPGAGVILARRDEGHHEHRQPHQQRLHQRAVLEPNVVVRNTACNHPELGPRNSYLRDGITVPHIETQDESGKHECEVGDRSAVQGKLMRPQPLGLSAPSGP